MAGERSRWVRRAAIAGGAAALIGVGTALAARRRAALEATGEGRPAAATLPEGRHLTVPTDDGARLAVTVAGPDDGPTVVLAHCWTGMRAIWAVVATQLVANGCRVVLYDQRGHGESTSTEDQPSMEALGDDLRAVLAAVDARDVVLVGHSMGGMSVQSYAAAHARDFTERVRAVVLVSTAARFLGRAVPAALVEWLMGEGRSEWTRRGAVGRRFVRGTLGRDARPADIDLTLQGFASTSGVARTGFLLAMAAMDLRAAGETIGTVPTAIVVGSRDTLTPVRLVRRLADGIPGAELDVIPGAGHMLPLEEPDRIVELVLAAARRPAGAAVAR